MKNIKYTASNKYSFVCEWPIERVITETLKPEAVEPYQVRANIPIGLNV